MTKKAAGIVQFSVVMLGNSITIHLLIRAKMYVKQRDHPQLITMVIVIICIQIALTLIETREDWGFWTAGLLDQCDVFEPRT